MAGTGTRWVIVWSQIIVIIIIITIIAEKLKLVTLSVGHVVWLEKDDNKKNHQHQHNRYCATSPPHYRCKGDEILTGKLMKYRLARRAEWKTGESTHKFTTIACWSLGKSCSVGEWWIRRRFVIFPQNWWVPRIDSSRWNGVVNLLF